MFGNDFITFLAKIALLFAAGLVPLMLGGKIAGMVQSKIGDWTKGMKKSSMARSRGGSSLAARRKDKEQMALNKAYGRMASGNAISNALGNLKIGKDGKRLKDTGAGKAVGLRSDVDKARAKSAAKKGYGWMENADKDALIDRIKPYSHPLFDANGRPVMKTHDNGGNLLVDANGRPAPQQVMGFDPRQRPDLARKFKSDIEAQTALEELNSRNLSDDNVTARERFLDDLNGYQIGTNDSDGLVSAGSTGFHAHWNPNALRTNFSPTQGMGGSKGKKATSEDLRKMESGWVEKLGNYVQEIQADSGRYRMSGGSRQHSYSSVDNETKEVMYFDPQDAITGPQGIQGVIQTRFGNAAARRHDFDKLAPGHSPRIVGYYKKILNNPQVSSLLTEQQRADIRSDLDTYYAGGIPQEQVIVNNPIENPVNVREVGQGPGGGPAPGGGGGGNVVPGPGHPQYPGRGNRPGGNRPAA